MRLNVIYCLFACFSFCQLYANFLCSFLFFLIDWYRYFIYIYIDCHLCWKYFLQFVMQCSTLVKVFFPLWRDFKYSVQFSHSFMSDSLWPHGLQQARLPCPSPTFGACSDSRPSSRWYHLTISSSVVPFSSGLQSFPASGSFQMHQFFPSGGQSIGASASTSVLPMDIQGWSPLEWTGWITLQSKRLSRVFSNTTVQKHQFFSARLSLWSNSHIHTLNTSVVKFINLLPFMVSAFGIRVIKLFSSPRLRKCVPTFHFISSFYAFKCLCWCVVSGMGIVFPSPQRFLQVPHTIVLRWLTLTCLIFVCTWVYLWTFCFVDLFVCFSTIPHCFQPFSVVVHFNTQLVGR